MEIQRCPVCGRYMSTYIIPNYRGGSTVNYKCCCGYQSINEIYYVDNKTEFITTNNTTHTENPKMEVLHARYK